MHAYQTQLVHVHVICTLYTCILPFPSFTQTHILTTHIHTEVTVGAGYSGACCRVSLELVLPQGATELPSNRAAHSSKLTQALMFVPPSKADDLFASHWISLVSLSVVTGC